MGLFAPLANLLSLCLTVVLVGSSFGLGSWILARFPGSPKPLERYLFSTALGAGALGTVILGLGSLGLLNPILLWALVLALGALGFPHLLDLAQMIRRGFRSARTSSVSRRDLVWALLLLGGAVLILGAFAPVTDWDSLMYHLEVPRQFIETGRVHVPEDNLHVAYVGLMHFLYLPLMTLGGWAGPALLNGAAAIHLSLAILAAGDRFFEEATGEAAAIAFFGTASIVLVAATPRVDVSLALFLFLAHYGLLVAIDSKEEWGLLAAALLLGFAVGIKYHALLYLSALVPFGIWALGSTSKRDSKVLAGLLGTCLVLGLLSTLPWVLKNVHLLGAPFYPLFTHRIPPPWLAELPGTVADSVLNSPEVHGVLAESREPFSIGQLFFSPGDLTVEAEARNFSTNPAFFFLPFSLFFLRKRGITFFLLPSLLYLLLLILPRDLTNLRYLIPVIPGLTLVSVATARRLATRVLRERWADRGILIGSLLALLPASGGIRREVLGTDRVAVAAGLLPSAEFLSRAPVPGFPAYFSVVQWTNETLPPGSRMLLLLEARGFYFQTDVLQDNILTNWPLLLSTGIPDRCLEGTGITHVLVNHAAAAYYQARGANLDHLEWESLPRFAGACLEPAYAGGGYEVYRVR